MIPRVIKGRTPVNLVRYLLGKGKMDEHKDPRVVAGDDRLVAGYGGRVLSAQQDGAALGNAVNYAQNQYQTMPADGYTVWHVPLSLAAEDGELSDAQWDALANRFVELVNFGLDDADIDSQREREASEGQTARLGTSEFAPDHAQKASTARGGPGGAGSDGALFERDVPAPVRWVAIRHGLNSGGYDHVHLVVSHVRDDGSVASWKDDMPRAQAAARQVEREFGLRQLRTRGQGLPGYQAGEERRAENETKRDRRPETERDRDTAPVGQQSEGDSKGESSKQAGRQGSSRRPRGRPVLTRHGLERAVRAAATASGTESEFLRKLHETGVLAAPRFAEGGTTAVTGYKVAARPSPEAKEAGEKPIWYGGGKLARDLTLPKLRAGWDDTSEERQRALNLWQGHAGIGHETTREAREPLAIIREEDWQSVHAEVARLNEWLDTIPAGDVQAWEHAASQAAGAFAGLANRMEPSKTGTLSQTSRSLARCAQPPRGYTRATGDASGRWPRLSATSAMLIAGATGKNHMGGWMGVMRQLERTVQAISTARELADGARHAQSRVGQYGAELVARRGRWEAAYGTSEPERRPGQRASTERGQSRLGTYHVTYRNRRGPTQGGRGRGR